MKKILPFFFNFWYHNEKKVTLLVTPRTCARLVCFLNETCVKFINLKNCYHFFVLQTVCVRIGSGGKWLSISNLECCLFQ